MLTNKIDPTMKLATHGFLIGVELEEGIDIEAMMKTIGDMLYLYPGVGTLDLEHLGELDVINETDENVTKPNGKDNEESEMMDFINGMGQAAAMKKKDLN